MTILIDLIHPANYHYFKYLIICLRKKNFKVIITARNKDVLQDLLEIDKIDYIDTGRGKFGGGARGKFFYLIYSEFLFFRIFMKYKPDYALSFGSIPCAHISYLLKIPHFTFNDTEHANLAQKLINPFVNVVFTPFCFYKSLGDKQFRFNSFMEYFYLNKKVFSPDKKFFAEVQKYDSRKIVLIRFVSWEAYHDIGQKGLDSDERINLVKSLETDYRVIISSEGELPEYLQKFHFEFPVNRMHDLLSITSLYIGEGGTMASEAALLGVPSIYVNSLELMGYLEETKTAGLLFTLSSFDEIMKKAYEILRDESSGAYFSKLRDELVKGKIEPNSFLLWFIENYPKSKTEIFNNPMLQNRFEL